MYLEPIRFLLINHTFNYGQFEIMRAAQVDASESIF